MLKLKSIGVKIKSVANNQAKVINAVKKNSKNISNFKQNTARQFNEFTDLIVDRMDSCEQMRKAECEIKNLELEKNIKEVEAKVNTLSEASEKLHCLRLNVSPIPVQIVESRGTPSSYTVLKKFHGLAW